MNQSDVGLVDRLKLAFSSMRSYSGLFASNGQTELCAKCQLITLCDALVDMHMYYCPLYMYTVFRTISHKMCRKM